MTEKGKLTGWHVLIALCLFFGVMIAVNVMFTVFAVTSFPGEQEEKSYVQGLNYNQTLKDKERQKALGWTTEIGFVETRDAQTPRLQTNWLDANGAGLTGLEVEAKLTRPTTDEGQTILPLQADGPGVYHVDLPDLGAGIWRIEVEAVSPDGDTAKAQKTLTWTP